MISVAPLTDEDAHMAFTILSARCTKWFSFMDPDLLNAVFVNSKIWALSTY
jgi:hypothetical protein